MLTLPVDTVLPAGPQGLQRRFAVRETPSLSPPTRRLLDRVRPALRARHDSRRTEDAYVAWIKRYIVFFHARRHPAVGAPEVTHVLSSLAVDGQVAASTQNQALSALLFLYRDVLEVDLPWLDGIVRAKRPQRLPVVLTRDEVHAVLQRFEGVPRLMACLLYGGGLRVLECCRLRAQDVDFATKGDKDRVTMRPAGAKADLAQHLETVRAQHHDDLAVGAGWVERPTARLRKYPNAGREWAWQWVFPATRIYRDRLTGQRRRHHLHETVLQRAVKDAVRRAGLAKRASPHTLRHLVRDASARGRPRHSHRAGALGASGCEHDDDRHARAESWAGRGAEPSGPDVHSVTWLAALEPNHSGIGCTVLQPFPAGKDLLNRRQAAEWKGPEGRNERLVPGRNQLQELAGVTVLRRSAYPVAEFETTTETGVEEHDDSFSDYRTSRC